MLKLDFNFNIIGLEFLFLVAGCVLFFVSDFVKKSWVSFITALVVLIFSLILVFFLPFGDFTQSFRLDFFSASMKFFMIFGGILILFLSRGYLETYPTLNYSEYFGLLLFSLLGSFVMVSAMDLLTFYIAVELMSFPVYFLIALNYADNKASLEGALKYFIVGCLGSVFNLIGLALVYYFTGTFILSTISKTFLISSGDKIPSLL